jgi:hypothetical protein
VVTANFSADQWGLLTYSFPRDEIENVADALNNALQDYVNNDYTKKETLEGMHKVLSQYSNYGAFDSEVRGFLDVVLEEIYK